MVEACGIPIATDDARKASTRRATLEFERVKSLYKDNSWVGELRGKCCKVITPLLPRMSRPRSRHSERFDEAGAQLSTRHHRAKQRSAEDLAKGVAVLQRASVLSDPLDAARSIGHFLGQQQTIRIMSETSKLHRERTVEARSNVHCSERCQLVGGRRCFSEAAARCVASVLPS